MPSNDHPQSAGIDVSHYQGTVDWGKVKTAGKCRLCKGTTESTDSTDSQFATNWAAMKAAGIIRGAYHFFHDDQDAAAQANHFLQVAQVVAGDLRR